MDVEGSDGPATYVIRPQALGISAEGALRATVTEAVYAGTLVRLTLQRGEQRLEAPTGTPVSPGQEVGLEAPRERLWRLPDEDAGPLPAGSSA